MHLRLIVVLVGLAAAFIGWSSSIAGAGSFPLDLSGTRTISVDHGAMPFVSDTLDGGNRVVRLAVPLIVTDTRGTGSGWGLTVTSTAFATAAGAALADDASTLIEVSSECSGGGACTNPANAALYPLAPSADATAPAPTVFFGAAPETGLGTFSIHPTIQVVIPADADADEYKSTLTFAVTTGP